MLSKKYYIYIMTNKANTVLYTGVTNNLIKRIFEHKNQVIKNSFTSKYQISKLVYYEDCEDIYIAIQREKHIKGGSRKKKISLIERLNPLWNDLAELLV